MLHQKIKLHQQPLPFTVFFLVWFDDLNIERDVLLCHSRKTVAEAIHMLSCKLGFMIVRVRGRLSSVFYQNLVWIRQLHKKKRIMPTMDQVFCCFVITSSEDRSFISPMGRIAPKPTEKSTSRWPPSATWNDTRRLSPFSRISKKHRCSPAGTIKLNPSTEWSAIAIKAM